jgi:uncharacterized protein YggE
MKIRNAIFLLLMLPLAAQAQEVVKGEHFIEVSGRAEQEIEPNEIYVTVRLREFEENKQKVALEKIDADFLAALKNAGIERSRLELSDVGANLGKLGKKDKDAYREKTYQVKLTSAAELEKLIAKMESVKVDYADVTRLHHTDLEKIKMELKVKALQVAKSKAETLLKSIGAEIGKPILVREIDFEPYQPQYRSYGNANVMMDAVGGVGESAVGFKKIRLQAQVTAQFEIK